MMYESIQLLIGAAVVSPDHGDGSFGHDLTLASAVHEAFAAAVP